MTQQADKPSDIGRNFLLGNRKKIAKFLMRTFTCRSTFLYVTNIRKNMDIRWEKETSDNDRIGRAARMASLFY
jgi:hypothetical protein